MHINERTYKKRMVNCIITGFPGQFNTYVFTQLGNNIADMLENKKLKDNLMMVVSGIRNHLKDGHKIINTNLPADWLTSSDRLTDEG